MLFLLFAASFFHTAAERLDSGRAVGVSSLAVHNIPSADGRQRAIDEIARVLAPGGKLALADIRYTDVYTARLGEHGLDPRRRGLGWRFWYGGPWVGTSLVTATRPG